MKHVSILLPGGDVSLVNIGGTHQLFNAVNEMCAQVGKPPLFSVHVVGVDSESSQSNGLFSIRPHHLLREVQHTDMIVIPAIHGNVDHISKLSEPFTPWLIRQYKAGAEIISLCIGSFFLAATGLLNGRQCSTHWRHAHDFRRMYPQAHLLDDKIITECEGIYTSGGAYAFTNLLLYVIEKHAGREMAVLISKTFMIDIDRTSQSPFIMFTGQKLHQDAEVLKAQEYIEKHYQDKITVETLSDNVGVGRRTFERRFKKATANTIIEYIQRVKIEASKKQLENGRKTINEVMYDVGYTDVKAFREVFRKVTGLSPLDYRKKYNKEAQFTNQ